ncbi:hypothetical protein HF872_04295 [Megasphaera hexanoica]|uniref:DNA binding HTH domain-containing protein n=1 Tax=Megasphaera hexanoica TaxID=1675036 RepID=A0A848BUF0_9FIRM|nr:hypothetical protein [Megasphaera hexanoica]NME27844.1 hypothetical protein [Megasphaera hexanoica]
MKRDNVIFHTMPKSNYNLSIFDETCEETAARLYMSRTTLWRLLHKKDGVTK